MDPTTMILILLALRKSDKQLDKELLLALLLSGQTGQFSTTAPSLPTTSFPTLSPAPAPAPPPINPLLILLLAMGGSLFGEREESLAMPEMFRGRRRSESAEGEAEAEARN